jgi:hypothetical protein
MSTKPALIAAFVLGVGFAGSANAQTVAPGLCTKVPCHITVRTAIQGTTECGTNCLLRAFRALPNAPPAVPGGSGFNFAGAIIAVFDYLDQGSGVDTLGLFTPSVEGQSTDSVGTSPVIPPLSDKNIDFFHGAISNYSGAGKLPAINADYTTPDKFLTSSASGGLSLCDTNNPPNCVNNDPSKNNEYQYGSFITIETNLGAGHGFFTYLPERSFLCIVHDDGMSVFYTAPDGTVTNPTTVTGPTRAVSETVQLPSALSFEGGLLGGDLTLYYSRQNGAPSVLSVTVRQGATACTR